ncbi:MAG: TonB-dependent receptor domain-containing protein, partial [Chromatiales bacterium]
MTRQTRFQPLDPLAHPLEARPFSLVALCDPCPAEVKTGGIVSFFELIEGAFKVAARRDGIEGKTGHATPVDEPGIEGRWEEGENAFDLPGLRLRGDRGIVTGFGELRAQAGAWAGFLGTHATLYFGTHLQLAPALKLRASGGRGYRAPSFHERLFIPFFGNPALRPEQGWSGDAGVDWTPSPQARLSLTGFYGRFEDLIQLDFEP